MGFTVHAPNRIDLAGGTTDIYPLCLFMDGGCTVNIAISVLSTAVVEISAEPTITLISEDQGETLDCPSLADVPVNGPLGLIARAVRALDPGIGLLGTAPDDRISLGLPRTPIRGRSAWGPMADRARATPTRSAGDCCTRTATSSADEAGAEGKSPRPAKKWTRGMGLTIRTRNQAPRGSGLGASSALLVAVLKGLFQIRNQEVTRRDIIDLAADIETAALGVPTGKQDYVAAAYGGFSGIEFRHGGFLRETVPDDSPLHDAIEQRLILAYTGEGHFSAMNNWDITKRYIDNIGAVRETLHRIRDVAVEMKQSLLREQWDELPRFVAREWELRRTLAPGVSTARIDAIMGAAGKAGALAGKVCGAGGGGCMATVVDPRRRAAVEQAMTAAGAMIMDFRVDRQGLRVSPEPIA